GGDEAPDEEGALRRLSALYVGVLEAGGLPHVSTPDLRRDDPPVPEVAEGDADRLRGGDHVTVDADRDTHYRRASVTPRRRGPLLVVGLPLDAVDDAVARLRGVLALAGRAVAAGLGLVAWWVVRRGIRPLREMTATAGAFAAGDLSRRVP